MDGIEQMERMYIYLFASQTLHYKYTNERNNTRVKDNDGAQKKERKTFRSDKRPPQLDI